MKALKFVVPLLVFVGVFGLFFASLHRDKQTLPSPYIGKQAPAFTLPSLSDASVKISNADFAGKPYVLNVWGTWCPECMAEHSVLLQLAKRNEIPIVGMDWNDEPERAALYLKKRGNPYSFTGVDPDGKLAIDWGVYGAPETFLVGADGTVLYKHISGMSIEIWEEKFLPLLGSNASNGTNTGTNTGAKGARK